MENYQLIPFSAQGVTLLVLRWKLPEFASEQSARQARYEKMLTAVKAGAGKVFEKLRTAYEADPDGKKRFRTRPVYLSLTVNPESKDTYSVALTCKAHGRETLLFSKTDRWDAACECLLTERKKRADRKVRSHGKRK